MKQLDMFDIIFIGVLITFTLIIFFWVRITIAKAIKGDVSPKLVATGYVLEKYQWLGPVPFTQLKGNKWKFSFWFSLIGTPSISLYVEIYCKKKDHLEQIRGIVRIKTLCFFTRHIEYQLEEDH